MEHRGLGLGHADLGRADDVVEEMVDADLLLEAPAERGVPGEHDALVFGDDVERRIALPCGV